MLISAKDRQVIPDSTHSEGWPLMEVVLKVLEGSNAGQEIKVPGDKFFIGRAEDCHLRPKSDLISRHHCCVMVEESFVAIRDFGSKNGTLINDERVIGERELKTGDVLQVGHLKFEILLSPTLGGKVRPKVTDIKDAVARTAQNASAGDDLDVTSWLADDGTAATHETRPLQAFQATATQDTVVADLTPDTKVPAGEEAAGGKKKFGKLPPVPKNTAKDSRDAAADTLRKLFKGR